MNKNSLTTLTTQRAQGIGLTPWALWVVRVVREFLFNYSEVSYFCRQFFLYIHGQKNQCGAHCDAELCRLCYIHTQRAQNFKSILGIWLGTLCYIYSVNSHQHTSDSVKSDDIAVHKCRLLDAEIPSITYNSGGTYTLGA